MGKERLLEEMKGHIIHKIAPDLNPTIRGSFQVRLIGTHRAQGEEQAEIELRLINDNREVVQSFGSKVVRIGGTITLNGFENTITYLPKELTK